MPEKTKREARSIHVFTEKFTEGEEHSFKVIKTLIIPGEAAYYLLESMQGNRLLMPMAFYNGYNIKPGDTIRCRIDKINCSGKIFLEPEHPYYKPGCIYSFVICNVESITDRKGRRYDQYTLSGNIDSRSSAIFQGNNRHKVNDKIQARLERIRKGVLILSVLESY